MFSEESLRREAEVLRDLSDSPAFWEAKRGAIREHILTQPLDEFLTWPAITSTMYVGPVQYVEVERSSLSAEWREIVGDEFNNHPNSNLTHQAFHMYNWERTTGLRVRDLHKIVEFGGGYGAMRVIADRAGFRGEYIIYDLPELSLLQRYYLYQMGVNAVLRTEFAEESTDLMIGLFSLSELDQLSLERYIRQTQARHILIASKDSPWEGRDNHKFIEASFPDASRVTMPTVDGAYYLIS